MLFILNIILISFLLNNFLLILFKQKITTFNCGIWAFHGHPKYFNKEKVSLTQISIFNLTTKMV